MPRYFKCECIKMDTTCSVCRSKPAEKAARAGTPGFRPPEVLMKVKNQTSAVDIWAVGVMMLSMMSRSYPFFKVSQ